MGGAEVSLEVLGTGELVVQGELVAIVEGNGSAQLWRQVLKEGIEGGKGRCGGLVGLMQEEREA